VAAFGLEDDSRHGEPGAAQSAAQVTHQPQFTDRFAHGVAQLPARRAKVEVGLRPGTRLGVAVDGRAFATGVPVRADQLFDFVTHSFVIPYIRVSAEMRGLGPGRGGL
jgi:hypothetical protein